MILKQPLRGRPLDDNGAIEFEQQEPTVTPKVTPTEVKEFLERMPEIRNELTNLSASLGYMWARLTDALDVIDFLLAEKSKIRREAFKEAEALCDQWGTMHGGTAQRIKREIHKLAEEVK